MKKIKSNSYSSFFIIILDWLAAKHSVLFICLLHIYAGPDYLHGQHC